LRCRAAEAWGAQTARQAKSTIAILQSLFIALPFPASSAACAYRLLLTVFCLSLPRVAHEINARAPFAFGELCGYLAAMAKISLVLIILATTVVVPAQAEDTFVPRLIAARHNYLQAVEVCLRRVIAASPVVGVRPEHIAKAAITTCRERDSVVRALRKRVYGFPSVDNFMAGVDDAIFAFGVKLAREHSAGSEPK
jgi:hypothetical protein